MPLSPTQMVELKKRCGQVLRTCGIDPNTNTGAKFIQRFWVGVLTAVGDDQDDFATTCLLSGRYTDLMS